MLLTNMQGVSFRLPWLHKASLSAEAKSHALYLSARSARLAAYAVLSGNPGDVSDGRIKRTARS